MNWRDYDSIEMSLARAAMRLDALGLAGPVLKVVNGDRPAMPMGKGKDLPGRRADER